MMLDREKESSDVNNSRARAGVGAGVACTGRPMLSAWNRLNGFAGTMGCRVSELSGPTELGSLAARMFGVDGRGSLDEIADRIEALGRVGRRLAAMEYIERNHPIPDALFPEAARARRPSKKIARAMAAADPQEGRQRVLLEATASQMLVEDRRAARVARQAERPTPEAPVPEKRAKARHKLNRIAERKMVAGEQLTREETKEVERRARQRFFRRAKAAKKAQAAA